MADKCALLAIGNHSKCKLCLVAIVRIRLLLYIGGRGEREGEECFSCKYITNCAIILGLGLSRHQSTLT